MKKVNDKMRKKEKKVNNHQYHSMNTSFSLFIFNGTWGSEIGSKELESLSVFLPNFLVEMMPTHQPSYLYFE